MRAHHHVRRIGHFLFVIVSKIRWLVIDASRNVSSSTPENSPLEIPAQNVSFCAQRLIYHIITALGRAQVSLIRVREKRVRLARTHAPTRDDEIGKQNGKRNKKGEREREKKKQTKVIE